MGLEKVIRQIAKAIFSEATHVKLGEKKFPILTKVGRKNLRHLEFVIDKVPYRAMEQNPDKRSHWARMTRNGAEVVWVWRYGRYYARLLNGRFTYL